MQTWAHQACKPGHTKHANLGIPSMQTYVPPYNTKLTGSVPLQLLLFPLLHDHRDPGSIEKLVMRMSILLSTSS